MVLRSMLVFLSIAFAQYSFPIAMRIYAHPLPSQASDNDGITALMRAARDGEYDNLKALLLQGVDVNAKDSWGWTVLIYAAAKGLAPAVRDLISYGADVNASDNNGFTPLMAASRYRHNSIVKLLLSSGADINAEDKNGSTALTIASQGRDNKKIVEILQNSGGKNPKLDAPPLTPPVEKPGDSRPVLLNRPEPSYTTKAREKKVEGTVYLRILIGSVGTVKKARVLVGLPYGLSYQAMDAANQLRFKPATKDGQPVQFWHAVEIRFNLRQ